MTKTFEILNFGHWDLFENLVLVIWCFKPSWIQQPFELLHYSIYYSVASRVFE